MVLPYVGKNEKGRLPRGIAARKMPACWNRRAGLSQELQKPMSRKAMTALQFDAPTAKRAQWEAFEFTLEAPGILRVANGSYGDDAAEHTYRVNVEGGVPVACECPADTHHEGACKHRVAVAIRKPVLDAASAYDYESEPEAEVEVATDGGQRIEGDGETTTPYTVHREPIEQGGKRYARCTGCAREILPVGRFDTLDHADGCPNANTSPTDAND